MDEPLPFKALDDLKISDFDRYPIWGFNLDRGETEPQADETWIEPILLTRIPKSTDGLFALTKVAPAEGSFPPAAVAFLFESRKVRIDGLAVLHPRYQYLPVQDGRVSEEDKLRLEKVHPICHRWFPLRFRTVLLIGTKEVALEGTAE